MVKVRGSGRGTDAAGCVGHRTKELCRGEHPAGELRERNACKDANQQLVGERFPDALLGEDQVCELWLATAEPVSQCKRPFRPRWRSPEQHDIGLSDRVRVCTRNHLH